MVQRHTANAGVASIFINSILTGLAIGFKMLFTTLAG